MAKDKDLGGRPPHYETPADLQLAVEDYFKNGMKSKTIIVGKGAAQTAVKIEVPTITGLCYWLGFDSRQSFYDYEKRDGFSYTIKTARLRIEQHYEELIQTMPAAAGPIFALKNLGWKDKQDIEHSGEIAGTVPPIIIKSKNAKSDS